MLLNVLREGSKAGVSRFILFGFMTVAVAGLVVMDIGGFFRGGVIGGDTVARIGHTKISTEDFNTSVRRVLSRQGIDPQMAYQAGVINRILASQINGLLINQAAAEAHIHVGDDYLVKVINNIIAPMTSEGRDRKDVLHRLLVNQGMTEGEFIQSLRQETSTSLLQRALGGGGIIPSQELKDLYQFQNEERTIKAIVLPDSAIKNYQDPKDEVLLPFYQAGQERYVIPETRNFTMAILNQDEVRKTVDISNEQLKKFYQDNIKDYTAPEQRVLEQSIFENQKDADAAVIAVKAGKTLESASKPGTYRGKQTYQQKGLPTEIAKDSFAATDGAVIGPVQTPLGWHVLIVKDILQPAIKSFDSVKGEIRTERLQTEISDQTYTLSGQIDDQLAGGTPLEDVVKSMNLKTVKFASVRSDGSTPDNHEGIKGYNDNDRRKILEAAFGLSEGESSAVFELADGSFAAVRIDRVNEKSYKPFDAVKGDLRKVWISDQQNVLNKIKAEKILADLASGKTLVKISSDFGVSISTITSKRAEKPETPLSPEAKGKFFDLAKGGTAMAHNDAGFIVGQVTDISVPDASNIPAGDLKKLGDTLQKDSVDETTMMLIARMSKKNNVRVNDAVLQKMYGPGSESKQ